MPPSGDAIGSRMSTAAAFANAASAGPVPFASAARARPAATFAARMPTLIELMLVVAAIAAVLPLFDRLAPLAAGRDQRFAEEPASSTARQTAIAMPRTAAATATARKTEAMRALVASAGLQWAAAMALGHVFLVMSRRVRRPALGAAAALAAWAFAAWIARVPWPFSGPRDFSPARPDADTYTGVPALWVLALAGAALVLAAAAWRSSRTDRGGRLAIAAPQAMSSRFGYAGFVAATGVGAVLLLDLSLDAHAGNRYLALYHQGHLWLAMLTLSLLLFARRPLAHGFAWALAVAGEAARRTTGRLGSAGAAALLLGLAGVGVLAFGLGLSHLRQLTSELGRVWLIAGAAWFFFLRAGPMTERIARAGPAGVSLLRYAWPLLIVAGVLVGAMWLTQDMGPLLIAIYAAGGFLAAAAAMWCHHRSRRVALPLVLAVLLFAAWIGGVTAALFQVGPYHAVTASRLESVAAPFASVNDQLALVSWFQRAAPATGFGVGAAPWCGFSPGAGCGGVPAQIHSDYTFTALVGVFGPAAAFAITLATALWLHRLIRHHGSVTRGEPRLVGRRGRYAADGQALLSWIAVAWVVLTSCQLAVTVAGNLTVLPLTGVTFPFVSFGMTSLLVNTAFLALCLTMDLPPEERDG